MKRFSAPFAAPAVRPAGIRRFRASFVLLGFAATLSGCAKADTERLAKVGAKIAQRAESLLPGGKGPLTHAWQVLPLPTGEVAVDARVAARLNWEKSLADAHVEVRSLPGEAVELRGSVRDLEQRRRAVAVAEATAGVEKVEDHLEIAPGGSP
jgi:hypothetical protein